MLFPLYNKLVKEQTIEFRSINDDIIQEQKDYFLTNIKQFTPIEHELCYALIRNFQLTKKTSQFSLPYNAKKFKKGIRFDFEKLPIELKQILYLFVQTHLNRDTIEN